MILSDTDFYKSFGMAVPNWIQQDLDFALSVRGKHDEKIAEFRNFVDFAVDSWEKARVSITAGLNAMTPSLLTTFKNAVDATPQNTNNAIIAIGKVMHAAFNAPNGATAELAAEFVARTVSFDYWNAQWAWQQNVTLEDLIEEYLYYVSWFWDDVAYFGTVNFGAATINHNNDVVYFLNYMLFGSYGIFTR